jgi:hypothetical protein
MSCKIEAMSHGIGRPGASEDKPAWQGRLSLYADLLGIVGGVGFVLSVLWWLLSRPQHPFFVILFFIGIGVSVAFIFVFLLDRLLATHIHPLESIGEHLSTVSEAQPPAKTLTTQKNAAEQSAHNLNYGVIERLPAHEENGILVEGHTGGESDAFVYGVKIGNKFDPSRKVGGINDVSAEIFYKPLDGQTLHVPRGAWLSTNRYRVDFGVNDEHRLVVAVTPERIPQGAQLVYYLRREISTSGEDVVDRNELLGGSSYRINIRLITEAENTLHKELPYRLTITRDPTFKIELVEDRQRPAPPIAQETTQPATPALQTPTAGNREATVRKLRGFLTEGRRLLNNSVNNTSFRESDFHQWEETVEAFIRENIGDADANEFITDAPIVPLGNPYSLLNTSQTNLINTRLARLSNLISKIQRS